jgi:hypothetical protein
MKCKLVAKSGGLVNSGCQAIRVIRKHNGRNDLAASCFVFLFHDSDDIQADIHLSETTLMGEHTPGVFFTHSPKPEETHVTKKNNK